MSKIGEAMAKAGNPSASSGPSAPEQQGPEVKDAEFRESKDDKGEAPKK